jgi:OmpA-OmpF porin, OOP family
MFIMKKLSIFILFSLLIYSTADAQNLVPNPSFEDYYACPYLDCMIYRATGWHSVNTSPDYFNACFPSHIEPSGQGVPQNGFGFQYASTGNAYAGLGLGYSNDPFMAMEGSEMIGIKLIQPLVIGQTYYASMKVAAVENPSVNCGCDKLGMLFTTVSHEIDSNVIISTCPFSPYSAILVNNFAHVYSTEIITDTANWTLISGSFVADSAYEYLAIGMFFENSLLNVQRIDSSIYECGIYYYIDDVYVGTEPLNDINDKFLNPGINIYPNPLSEYAIIELNGHITDIEIFDLNGRKHTDRVFTDIRGNTATIRRGNLHKGIYIIKIYSENQIFYRKIIIN